MVKTYIGAAGSRASVANTTEFWFLGGIINANASETNQRTLFRLPGVASNLYCRITANAIAATSTFRTRLNAANGGQSVSIGSTATGEFTDSSGTDTLAAGDKLCYSFVPGAATNTATFSVQSCIFAATTDTVTRLHSSENFNRTTASTTSFTPLCGAAGVDSTTETNAKQRMRKSFTLKNACACVSAARATASTVRSRKNGANGNLSISCTAATTGFFEDTSNTDTVSAGEDWNWSITTGTGVDTLTIKNIWADLLSTNGDGIVGNAHMTAVAYTDATVRWTQISGIHSSVSTEVNTKADCRIAGDYSELTCLVTQNDIGTASTVLLRKNGADSTLVVSCTASTTGVFSDSTHTETLVSTDEVNLQITAPSVGGTHTVTIANYTMVTHITDLTRISKDSILKFHILGRISQSDIYKYHVVGRISQSDIYKYHVLGRISLSRIYKYHLLARIALSRIYKYHVLGRVSLSRIYKSHIQGRVSLSRVYKYHLLTRVSLARSYLYHLLSRTSLSRIYKYNTVGRVSLSRTYLFNVLQRISLSRVYKYHVANLVSLSQTYKYHLLGRVSLSRSYLWNLIGRVSKSSTYKYNIIGRVSLARSYLYNVLGRISKASILKYNVIQRISVSGIYLWNLVESLLERVSKPQVYKYNVVGRVSLSRVYKHNILGRISLTRIYLHNIVGRISSAKTYKYDLLGRISQSRIYRYHVSVRVSLSRTYKYHITNLVSKASIFKYNVIGRVSLSRIYKHNITGRISKPSILKYNIVNRISQSSILKWHLVQRVTQSSILRYNIISRITSSITLVWNIGIKGTTRAGSLKSDVEGKKLIRKRFGYWKSYWYQDPKPFKHRESKYRRG